MRAVAPDRRPPVQAWGLAALALWPLVAAWAGYRFGWRFPAREVADIWGLVLLGLFAGVIAAATFLRGRWLHAYLLLIGLALLLAVFLLGLASLAESVSAGFVLIFGLDLWMARAGLMPEWWPRLKLGVTILAVVLLLAPTIG